MSNKAFRKPDVRGPRFRPEVYQVMNDKFFNEFRKKYPQYKDLTDPELRKIGKTFNTMFWEHVIDKRDGVELPEGLGYIFIGTCKKSTKKNNVDYAKSNKYGIKVTNKNWETDGRLAKIFYTNYTHKYKFVHRECWAFVGCRNFKRTVAKTYPENWNMYVTVDPHKKIRKMFQANILKDINKRKQDKDLEDYNEFDL
jgi:hypothetical protein